MTWCVEMTMPNEPRAPWLAMHCPNEVGQLVYITRAEAIGRAAILDRHSGMLAYRVRPMAQEIPKDVIDDIDVLG